MMTNTMMRLFARRAVQHATKSATKKGNNPLDVRFGMALVRDRRVPISSKLFATLLGVGLMAILVWLEIPAETLLSLLAPILTPFEFAIDGIEVIVLPVLFTALLLAFVAPRNLVDTIRAERLGLPVPGNDVIDVQSVAR